jgi:hypothetical protein
MKDKKIKTEKNDWITNVVRQTNNCSHNTFRVGFRPHPL